MSKYCKSLILCLLFCIVFMLGFSPAISPKSVTTIKELKLKDIKTAKINLGGRSEKYAILSIKNSKDINDIIRYLHSGKIQGYADEKVSMKGASPMYLLIELKNKTIIQIKPTVGNRIKTIKGNITEISQYDVPNQVTVNTNLNEKAIRIFSVELRKLINNIFNNSIK